MGKKLCRIYYFYCLLTFYRSIELLAPLWHNLLFFSLLHYFSTTCLKYDCSKNLPSLMKYIDTSLRHQIKQYSNGKFNNWFCSFSLPYCQILILEGRLGTKLCLRWILKFSQILFFSKTFSKSFGNSWRNSYIQLLMITI